MSPLTHFRAASFTEGLPILFIGADDAFTDAIAIPADTPGQDRAIAKAGAAASAI